MHLIPFKGRNRSKEYDQNLLWNEGRIYIMDNHRAAAWCWAQHIPKEEQFSIFHIDRHTDLLQSGLDEWCSATPPIETLTIDQYLELDYLVDGTDKVPVFSWENYLPIFVRQREKSLYRFSSLCHGEGDEAWFEDHHHDFFRVPRDLEAWLEYDAPWILNFDLDVFFTYQGGERFIQVFSDDYIRKVAETIRDADNKDRIRCMTIAISPEMCGGWASGIRVLKLVTDVLGIRGPNVEEARGDINAAT